MHLRLCLGTMKERGIAAWQDELQTGSDDDESVEKKPVSAKDREREQKLRQTLYVIPGFNRIAKRFSFIGKIPICQKYNPKLAD